MDVFDAVGAPVTITGDTTNSLGNYTILLPGPGTYVVRANPSTTQPYGAQYYDNTPLKSLATPVAVASGAAVTNINFSLPSGVLLTGQVTADGLPAGSIDMDVFADNGEFLSSYPATTLADGTFTVGALPPGQYFVRADPDITLGQMYVRGYYGGGMNISTATPIVVGATNVSGITIALATGGTIRGTVTDLATGTPLPSLDLDIYDSLGARVTVTTNTGTDGTYELGALPTGDYALRVDPTVAQGYARTYYAGVPISRDATLIHVVAGTATANIDFALVHGGSVSGTIRRASDNLPVSAIDLDLFDANGSFMPGYTAKSDVAGAYQLGPVVPGTYYVRADPSVASGLADQFYAGKIDIGAANPVAVTASTDTGNVNFSLFQAGAITGVIRDQAAQAIADIDIDLFDSAGNRMRKGAMSAVDGTYGITTLAPGTYHVRADPSAAQGFARVYFDTRLALAAADDVIVTGGDTTGGIDFALPLGSVVSGHVTDDNGTPLSGISVHIVQTVNGALTELDQSSLTDTVGAYVLEAQPAGDYLVRADPDAALSAPIYYGDTTDETLATVISLAPGQNADAIDIRMPFLASAMQCGNPALTAGSATPLITAADALAALRSAVGAATCAPCVCDVDASGKITASDALSILANAVGRNITLHCPACA